MTRAATTKPYRAEQRHQMTPAWKDAVRKALASRGVSEQWLADQIAARRRPARKMKRDTINKLLRKQTHSALVPDICAILDLAPPMITTPDDETQHLIDLAIRAPSDVRRAVISLLESSSKTS